MTLPTMVETPCRRLYDSLLSIERVPYSLLALPLRAALVTVFWNSGHTKILDWSATIALFTDDFHLPSFMPPVVAAVMATILEIGCSLMLTIGFATRLAAALLFGMTAFIEIFVFPDAWPIHIQWAAMLLILIWRGAGGLSLDHWLRRSWERRQAA